MATNPTTSGHKSKSEYFSRPPRQWSILGYYEYRKKQPDFSGVFDRENDKLKKDLNAIASDINTTDIERQRASALQSSLRKQLRDPSIARFWNAQDELKTIKTQVEIARNEGILQSVRTTTDGVLSAIKATNEIHHHNLQSFLELSSDVKNGKRNIDNLDQDEVSISTKRLRDGEADTAEMLSDSESDANGSKSPCEAVKARKASARKRNREPCEKEENDTSIIERPQSFTATEGEKCLDDFAAAFKESSTRDECELEGEYALVFRKVMDKRNELCDRFAAAYNSCMAATSENRGTFFSKLEGIADSYIYWKIIEIDDAVDPLNTVLNDNDRDLLRTKVNKAMSEAKYDQISQEASTLIGALKLLTPDELCDLGNVIVHFGTRGAVNHVAEITKGRTLSSEDSIFEDELPINKDYQPSTKDYEHPDVIFVLDMVKTSWEIIEESLSAIEMSERDGDMIFFSRLFRIYKGIFDRHFGEPVSRASRQRRKSSIDANSKTEGHHQDWIFTLRDAKADTKWGLEMGGCERAGARKENMEKKSRTRLKEAKALRDQRDLLLRNIIK
ncbi:hypothetical protein BC936DRAFT_149927 [Jimgerdemannia flammicorona]|uniref:Uncharacterized protein n=1 Tax=Jimgerdemannia flammicorona TaxID=994334 RepID=A0A433CZU4_9FUNG|nr:hypothetical protein BC936DRAFT_149927 [Jimgerdemannia flammicorona]